MPFVTVAATAVKGAGGVTEEEAQRVESAKLEGRPVQRDYVQSLDSDQCRRFCRRMIGRRPCRSFQL
jgi:hypothetical protein